MMHPIRLPVLLMSMALLWGCNAPPEIRPTSKLRVTMLKAIDGVAVGSRGPVADPQFAYRFWLEENGAEIPGQGSKLRDSRWQFPKSSGEKWSEQDLTEVFEIDLPDHSDRIVLRVRAEANYPEFNLRDDFGDAIWDGKLAGAGAVAVNLRGHSGHGCRVKFTYKAEHITQPDAAAADKNIRVQLTTAVMGESSVPDPRFEYRVSLISNGRPIEALPSGGNAETSWTFPAAGSDFNPRPLTESFPISLAAYQNRPIALRIKGQARNGVNEQAEKNVLIWDGQKIGASEDPQRPREARVNIRENNGDDRVAVTFQFRVQ